MKEFNNCDKHFCCDTPGCLLKFPDEDLLSAHKKRHDINLTITQRANNVYSDQTPTPTRFLRNCEEVGLFQDLQNVNPFEETFRKAVEAVHQGQTIILGKSDNLNHGDDTLHTPNILFPSIHDVQFRKETEQLLPSEEVPTPITPTKPKIRKYQRKKPGTTDEIPLTTFMAPEQSITFKLPIPRSPANIKMFYPKYFSVLSKNVKKQLKTPSGVTEQDQATVPPKDNDKSTNDSSRKTNLQEYNRLAQMRARQKRKDYLGYLEETNGKLTDRIATLEKQLKCALDENTSLKRKIDDKASIGFDASTQTVTRESNGFQDHDYIANDPDEKPEPGMIKKPFKKRNLQPKLCISCNTISTE